MNDDWKGVGDDDLSMQYWKRVSISADGATVAAVTESGYLWLPQRLRRELDSRAAALILTWPTSRWPRCWLKALGRQRLCLDLGDAGTTWATEPPANTLALDGLDGAPADAGAERPRGPGARSRAARRRALAATVSVAPFAIAATRAVDRTPNTGARNWASIAMSADGQWLTAVEGGTCYRPGSVFWTSSDQGRGPSRRVSPSAGAASL